MRAFILALALLPAAAEAVEVGLSAAGVYGGDVAQSVRAARVTHEAGATWARINFRLDVWTAPDDATPRGPQQLTWFQAYDQIVDELTSHGVQVYGLIGAESVPGGGEPESDAFIAAYSAAFVQIVDHFKDRVRVFETFNEPNNWRPGETRPELSPYWFAKAQQEVYLATKHHAGRSNDPCSQVSIVSGPLLSFDGTDAASYLADVYWQGRNALAWDWVKANTGSYPLDGVGYHIYVGQGPSATTASVKAAIATNLQGLWQAVIAEEGTSTPKRVWLSEVGWSVDQVTDAQQASFLTASFDAFAADARIATAFWFHYQDFPSGSYGLYDAGGLLPANRRPSYAAFTAAVEGHPPVRGARFVSDNLPATLEAGETRTVTLWVENLGAQPWSAATDERLGAAPGCPAAAAVNQLAIEPGLAGGWAQSPVDARFFLDPAAQIATGQNAGFQLVLTAPDQPGSYTIAVRMVDEGVAWFGDTLRRTVTVVPRNAGGAALPAPGEPGTAGPGDGLPDSRAKSAGCALAGPRAEVPTIAFLLFSGIFLLALSRCHRY